MMQEEQRSIEKWIGRAARRTTVNIEKIPGDASTRRYYRAQSGKNSMIVMKMDAFEDVGPELPFLQVQRHLHSMNIAVPEVIDFDPKQGIILLSDLGDETLLKRLEKVSRRRDQTVWFKCAIDLLVAMQSRATKDKADIDAYGLYFDEEKLMWEVNFTLTHFYNGALAREIPDKEKKLILDQLSKICKTLSSQPWYFTHRDFHSRNIMVHEERLFMIDFQDARMGCCQYDLASLLRDSYYQLDEEHIEELVEYYYRQLFGKAKPGVSISRFIEIFDLMSIQRNFKAIGSFASFYNKRQDVRYLKFIGNTFENVRRNLLKFSDLDELRRILFKYYYF